MVLFLTRPAHNGPGVQKDNTNTDVVNSVITPKQYTTVMLTLSQEQVS